jgi:hypothetical protein
MKRQIETYFYAFRQNNSGGSWIRNDVVDVYLVIEARSDKEAEQRAFDIAQDYSDYCSCCGHRWSFDWADKTINAANESELVLEVQAILKGGYDKTASAIVHYYNGETEKVTL